MKYQVIGWTSYDDETTPDGEITDAVVNTIIDDIKKNQYLFSGYEHQEFYGCTPVLNDGSKRCFSQRFFGDIMAKAQGEYGRYDYASYLFMINEEYAVRPPSIFQSELIKSKEELIETYYLDEYKYTLNDNVITVVDCDYFRYIEKSDYIIINNITYVVKEINRYKDLLEDFEKTMDAYILNSETEKFKQAESIYINAKTLVKITIEKFEYIN